MLCYSTGQVFSYPDDFLAPDLALICIMAVLEALRLYLGMSCYHCAFSGGIESLSIHRSEIELGVRTCQFSRQADFWRLIHLCY